MALFRKLFYRKPPDGLLEISERVYVFDCCFTTDAWEERNYKSYVGTVISQLRDHYPDASILVFNFREGESESQIANVLSEYDMTIMDYPRHYEGCPLLSLEVMHHFLRSSESWLSLGQQNVLLMHCERGGWPVLAFMLAALLIYRNHYTGEQKTLDMVYKQAPRELVHLLSPLNPIPSQLRYLQYVSRRNVATEWPPLDRALTLDCIIIRMIPDFDGEGGCRPIFRIYGQDPFLVADRTPKVLFSTPKKSKTVRHYRQAECELVKIDINCHIQGDVVLECISLHDDMEREEMMFRVMFNTAFIRSNILILNRDEIDVLWNAKDQFPKDFRAEVLFSEMDAAASIIPLEFSCFEEKDGLPVEAFAKVHEIFSSVDWLGTKGDAALNAIQQLTVNHYVQEKLENDSHQITEISHLSHKSIPESPREKQKLAPVDNKAMSSVLLISGKQSPTSEVLKKNSNLRMVATASEAKISEATPTVLPAESSVASPAYSSQTQEPGTYLQRGGNSQNISSPSLMEASYSKEIHSTKTPSPPVPAKDISVGPVRSSFSLSPIPPATPPLEDKRAAPPPSSPPPPPPPPPLRFPGSQSVSSKDDADAASIPEASSPSPSNFSTPSPTTITKNDIATIPEPPESVPPLTAFSSTERSATQNEPVVQSALLSSTKSLKEGTPIRSACPPPPPPPPPPLTPPLKEAIAYKGGPGTPQTPVSVPPPPPPPPNFPVKDTSTSSGGGLPPSPPPLNFPVKDNSTSRGEGSPLPPPPPPPPNLSLKDISASRSEGPPPPPPPPPPTLPAGPAMGTATSLLVPPPPPAPAPLPSTKQLDSSSKGTPIGSPAPPPPAPPMNTNLRSTGSGGDSTLSSSASPPPPSIPPPNNKGRTMLSRTMTSRNNQTKKLKPLHWLKLTRAVQGSLWAEAQKSGEASRAPEIDISELESLFSASVPNSDHGSSGKKSSSRSALGQKAEKVQLVEHRRAYNCEIMLSKVKIPLHDLMGLVLSLEDSALDVDQVDNLIKFCPTKEEMELLKGYQGDKDKLGRCEQFFLELMQVPRVESKLRVFSFKIQFRSQVSELRNNLNIVNSAADQIRGSAKLKRVMQTILSLGNALNQGTARGAAIGFRLDSLLKLTDTRARNNKMTLMHYLCKVLSDKLPELLDFSKDLSSLEPASKIQLKYLAEEMQAISKGLEKVVQELSLSENDGPVSENFHKALKEFLRFAEGEVRSLALLYSGVGRNVDALILYFGEDPSRCPFEQVISTLFNFVKTFNRAHEENSKQLELERKKAEKDVSMEKLKVNAAGKDTGHLIQSAIKTVR